MDKQQRDSVIAFVAIGISLLAAGFTGMQWFEACETRIADQRHFDLARQDAEKAAKAQGEDVERSAVSAERSAKSSEKSTNIADESLRLNREMFRVSERAFVHVKGISFVLEANQPAKVTLEIVNAGRTTAKGTLSFANILPTLTVLPEHPADARSTPPNTPSDLVAGDTRFLTVPTSVPLAEDDVKSIKAGTAYLYSYGHIEYRDIFNQRRKTMFCAQYNKDEPGHPRLCPFLNTVE